MLEIKLKETYESLDLAKQVTINTVKESPIFQAEIKQSSISYNFTIGYTDRNAKQLKLPAELESPDKFETFDIFLIIENSYEIEATLEVLEVLENKSGKFIKLKLDAIDFPADFLKEDLVNFDYGDEIALGTTTQNVKDHATDANTKSYDDTSHVFPMIYNEAYYNGDNAEYLNVINNFDISSGDFIDNTDSPVKNKNVLIPYFFLLWIFKQIFENNGITLKGNFMDDPEIQKLIVHNNYGLDEFDIERTFVRTELTSDAVFNVITPVVYKKNDRTIVFDDDSTFPNEDTDAIYNTGTGAFAINQVGILKASIFNLVVEMHQWGDGYTTYNDQNTNNFITKFFVCVEIDGVLRSEWNNWLLTSGSPPVLTHVVGVNANGAPIVSFPAITLPDVNLVAADIGKSAKITVGCYYYTLLSDLGYSGPADNRFITVYSGAIAEMNLEKWSEFNVYSKTINPANHLPKMTAESFVNAYIKSFRIMPVYNKLNKELHLNYFKDIAADHKYNDITNYIESRATKKLNYTGVNLKYNTEGDDLIPEKAPGITQYIYIGEFDKPSNLPTPSSVSLLAYIKNENAWYLSKVTTGITFERYKEGFDALIIEDGSEPYIIDWSPFLMKYQTIDNNGAATMREFLLPNISETGSSLYFDIGINDPQFKTLIWHGMVDGPTALQPYPFASSYNIDHNGNEISDLTFKLANEEGSLYYEYLKDYFNFLLTTKKVEHVYTTNLKHPLNYNFFEKKLIINQRFLTGKLKLKITNTGFASIIAENYTT